MKKLIYVLYFLSFFMSYAQEETTILSLEEFLGYVKKYHPVLKQAMLVTTEGEAKLLKARGAFDPKVEVDYNRKKFKESEYYDKLNATFKIPTWYGIELKANYENNEGVYLNPEATTPDDGLYSVGVSVSLAKGLLTNKRMATLKQAKLYAEQAAAKQTLLINEMLYEALVSYFNWLKNYQSRLIFGAYLQNGETLLTNVRSSFLAGDKPAVDTLEASINVKNRLLDVEKARIGYIKATLELSNYLWLEDNLPLELESTVIPDVFTSDKIDLVVNNSILNTSGHTLENHPKLKELQAKKEILTIDKRLKTNNLLPKIDLQYNFLTTDYDYLNAYSSSNYKSGLNISLPLFLRKERAELKLTKLKLRNVGFDISATKVSLENKIKAVFLEIASYQRQKQILLDLVTDYKQLVKSEERKFNLGEGSLFLVNYREVKLIENQLKQIDTEYQLFNSKSNLSRVIGSLN